MKSKLLATLLAAISISANAAVLTFDDIPGSTQNNWDAIGTYDGFTFGAINGGANRLDWIDTVGSSWNFGAVSGEFTMLNNYGGTGIIKAANGSDFTFDGLWAETWSNAGDRTAYIRGFNNGVEIWTSTINLGPQFSHFGGMTGAIDELRLDFGNYFLVDNLALNEQQRVPEPASLALLGLGLASLTAARRRKSA